MKKALTNYINFIKANPEAFTKPLIICNCVPERLETDIYTLIGINVKGWKIELPHDSVVHIEKSHGKKGTSDRSMSRTKEYVKIIGLNNLYDSISEGKGTKMYKNNDGSFSRTIVLSKRIDDKTIFLIEAVPDSKRKTIQIISIYQNKISTSSV